MAGNGICASTCWNGCRHPAIAPITGLPSTHERSPIASEKSRTQRPPGNRSLSVIRWAARLQQYRPHSPRKGSAASSSWKPRFASSRRQPAFAMPWFRSLPVNLSSSVPFLGSLLSPMSALASPASFVWSRLMDAMLSAADHRALDVHARVERWALDEVPLPGKLVHEIIEWLYRENRFCRGV